MLEHEDNSIVRVMIDDDKNGRKDVECLSHAISLSTGEPLPWFPSFRDSRMGLPFVVTDFEGSSVLSSSRMRLDGEGRYTYCAERKAYDAFVAVQPLAWGLSQQQLHEGQLQGTHALRNLGGDITEQLRMGGEDGECCGGLGLATQGCSRRGGCPAVDAQRRPEAALQCRHGHPPEAL